MATFLRFLSPAVITAIINSQQQFHITAYSVKISEGKFCFPKILLCTREYSPNGKSSYAHIYVNIIPQLEIPWSLFICKIIVFQNTCIFPQIKDFRWIYSFKSMYICILFTISTILVMHIFFPNYVLSLFILFVCLYINIPFKSDLADRVLWRWLRDFIHSARMNYFHHINHSLIQCVFFLFSFILLIFPLLFNFRINQKYNVLITE